MRIGLASAPVVLLAAMSAAVLPAQSGSRVYSPRESDNAPQIDLWLDQVNYRIGDRIAPHFISESGAYVTIVRVTSDGQLRVLYPRHPRDQKQFQQAQLVNDRVQYNSFDRRFEVFESQGMGFVFAVASFQKFDFSYFTSGGDWSVARLDNDGRYGDPFEIVRRFVDRTLSDRADFSMDYVAYEVTNNAARSRYASRYGYDNYDDFYDSCISAFGVRYTPYCGGRYYPGSYPVIVSRTQTPGANVPINGNYAGKHIRPLTGDPLVANGPSEPQVAPEGRLPDRDRSAEAAAAVHRERLLRDATPRDRAAPNIDTRGIEREPRIYTAPEGARPEPRAEPRSEPRVFTAPERPRAEPQIEIRSEPRQQSPPPPPPPARVEVRNEPAPAPRSDQAPRPVAAPTPAPAPTKDN